MKERRTRDVDAARCPKDGTHVGLLGRPCPECGGPMEPGLLPWRTSLGICPACGEVLGTARPALRQRNRRQVTVYPGKCEDCGVPVCSVCRSYWITNEVIGTYYRRTEGGARIPRNRYRWATLCRDCHVKRVAARAEAHNSQPFRCDACGYTGRRDSFKTGISDAALTNRQEYPAGCPQCGFYWTPQCFEGIGQTTARQIRPAAVGGAS